MQGNPFGAKESRLYIDDMTSSSGQLSGVSENADCFPVVEQVNTVTSHISANEPPKLFRSYDHQSINFMPLAQLEEYGGKDQLALHSNHEF